MEAAAQNSSEFAVREGYLELAKAYREIAKSLEQSDSGIEHLAERMVGKRARLPGNGEFP